MEAIIHFTVPVCLFLSFDSSLTYCCVLKSAYCIDKMAWCVNNFFVLHFRYDLFSLAKDIVLVGSYVVLQLNACSMFSDTAVNCKNRTVRTVIFALSFSF